MLFIQLIWPYSPWRAELTPEVWVEPHSLNLQAIDRAAVFEELGMRTCWIANWKSLTLNCHSDKAIHLKIIPLLSAYCKGVCWLYANNQRLPPLTHVYSIEHKQLMYELLMNNRALQITSSWFYLLRMKYSVYIIFYHLNLTERPQKNLVYLLSFLVRHFEFFNLFSWGETCTGQ